MSDSSSVKIARRCGQTERPDLLKRDLGEGECTFVLVAWHGHSSLQIQPKILGHAFTARRAVRNARNLRASDERAVNKRTRAARATMRFHSVEYLRFLRHRAQQKRRQMRGVRFLVALLRRLRRPLRNAR